jgi:hypothetical protein
MISDLSNVRLGRCIGTVSYSSVQPRTASWEDKCTAAFEAGDVQIRVGEIVADSTPQQQRVKAASYK